MVLIVALLLILVAVELWLSRAVPSFWRNSVATSTILLIIALSIDLLITDFSLFSVLVGLVSLFRVVNISRLLHGHKQGEYLANIVHRSVIKLIVYLGIVCVVQFAIVAGNISNHELLITLVALQFIGALVVAGTLLRSYKRMTVKKTGNYIKSQELPSLTVAIPARNETKDLEECLDRLVESDYPKLEILVLDDCSQTKQTPEIIKGYAQAGIRFVEGEEAPNSWTAKNYAYQQLLDQASSDLILFCGVDVRFQADTIRLMVEELLNRKKKMISFMPLNISDGLMPIHKLAVQTWRYFWELSVPRRLANRPPVLSTCWLIDSSALKEVGGFKAVSREILPERYFARQMKEKGLGYAFLRTAGSDIRLECQKDYLAQLATAKRTIYPLMGNNLEDVLLGIVDEATFLVVPFALFVTGAITADTWLTVASLINYLILGVCFWTVAKLTYGNCPLWAVLFMPSLAVFNIHETLKSMYAYEFKEVIWKDRNVCIPIMRATVRQ